MAHQETMEDQGTREDACAGSSIDDMEDPEYYWHTDYTEPLVVPPETPPHRHPVWCSRRCVWTRGHDRAGYFAYWEGNPRGNSSWTDNAWWAFPRRHPGSASRIEAPDVYCWYLRSVIISAKIITSVEWTAIKRIRRIAQSTYLYGPREPRHAHSLWMGQVNMEASSGLGNSGNIQGISWTQPWTV